MNTKAPLSFIYIYLTDACNLKCIHCWQSAPISGKGNNSSLIFSDCKRFLDAAIEMGMKNVTISGGEPLLNPEFKKFAEYFHGHSIKMSVETNGILISTDQDIFNTIKNHGVYCAISIDGITPAIHNQHRGRKDAFELTVAGINKLEEAKISYQLIMAISKFNYHELIPLLDWVKAKCKGCNLFKINVINALGRAKNMQKKGLIFDAGEVQRIGEEIAGLVERYPIISLHVDPAFISFKNLMLKYSCGGYCGYTSSLSILANGNISICSLGKQMDKYTFGHVSTIDLKNVWDTHPFLAEIHEKPYGKLKGICANCIFRRQCEGGCRAEALCTYGDFFAPQPLCQSYYESGKFPKERLIDPSKQIIF